MSDDTQEVLEGISPSVAARLESAMRHWRVSEGDRLDAFRYEAFARRIVAATHGRPDAVKWAQDWFESLIKEDQEALARAEADLAERHNDALARSARVKEEILRGYSGNPHFQAFLDTLEDPSILYDEDGSFKGYLYLCWIGPVIGQVEREKAFPNDKAEQIKFMGNAIRRIALSQRAQRLGGPVHQT